MRVVVGAVQGPNLATVLGSAEPELEEPLCGLVGSSEAEIGRALRAVGREVVMSPGRRRIKRLSQMQSLKESAGPCRGSEERKVLKGRDNEDGEGMVLVRDWSLETVAVRKLIWASLGNMHMFMSWIRHRQRGQHLRGSTLTNDIRRLPSRCRFGDVDL